MASSTRIAVIGLGYVGLPLAIALARRFSVVGYDKKASRIDELKAGRDRTGEVDRDALRGSTIRLTTDEEALARHDIYIITVPTPVDTANKPDLAAVIAACGTVGRAMARGAIVVLESTVYPGVTEGICGPSLEAASGLVCGSDFYLGYSPERINPGDREHTVDRITKVVAGQTPETARTLANIYGAITTGGAFIAASIKAAEAAKVIENAQRDINIAFINEVTVIFNRLGLSVHDVLAASATKWNFLRFSPGLVGGHCIGVDPFYLADLAQRIGHDPEVILAGRRINDRMGHYVAAQIAEKLDQLKRPEPRRILILGLTFKENVPDIRNSKVIDLVRDFVRRGWAVDVHDPHADPREVREEYEIDLMTDLSRASGYDAVVGAVAHEDYRRVTAQALQKFLVAGGLVADVKGMWRGLELTPDAHRWEL